MSAKSKGRKAGKKTVEKTRVFFLNMLVAVIIILCALGIINNYAVINRRNERLADLNREYNSLRIKNDELRNRIELNRMRELDEDYIVDFARAHGLRRDNEILFYLNPER